MIATLLLACFLDSGPTAGSKAEPLKVRIAAGDDVGQELTFATKRADKPTVVVFVQAAQFSRPAAQYLRTLDKDLGDADTDAATIAVWLTDDAAKTKEYLPKVQQSLNLVRTTWTLFEGDKAGPTGWAVDPEVAVTAVVLKGGKVVKSFAYRSINGTDVAAVVKEIKK